MHRRNLRYFILEKWRCSFVTNVLQHGGLKKTIRENSCKISQPTLSDGAMLFPSPSWPRSMALSRSMNQNVQRRFPFSISLLSWVVSFYQLRTVAEWIRNSWRCFREKIQSFLIVIFACSQMTLANSTKVGVNLSHQSEIAQFIVA